MVVAIGIYALGYRELLGIAVGHSNAQGFWRHFLAEVDQISSWISEAAESASMQSSPECSCSPYGEGHKTS